MREIQLWFPQMPGTQEEVFLKECALGRPVIHRTPQSKLLPLASMIFIKWGSGTPLLVPPKHPPLHPGPGSQPSVIVPLAQQSIQTIVTLVLAPTEKVQLGAYNCLQFLASYAGLGP